MEKIVVTSYGKTIKLNEIKHTFMEFFAICVSEPPYMVGAVLNNDEVVCIARFTDCELAMLAYSQFRGIYNHSDCCKDVYNINIETESLKIVLEVIDSVGKPGDYVREMLLQASMQQLMDGIAPPVNN